MQEKAAVRLGKLVGYRGAGTVEYLFVPDKQRPGQGQYYFLELNPRLQVEHPCTEMVTKANLPAMQLQVSMRGMTCVCARESRSRRTVCL
jgi:acetyl-CoA carboxylase/biotin carboxylase 1